MGHFLKKNELNSPYRPGNRELDFSVEYFPYISYKDVLNDINYEFKNYSPVINNFSKYHKVAKYFLDMKKTTKGIIGLIPGSISSRAIIPKLIRGGYKINLLNEFIMPLDILDEQIKLLSFNIKSIF